MALLSLPAGLQASFQQALDDYMTLVAVPCILFFPPILANATYPQNPPGNLSSSTWAAGGPSPVSSWQGHNPYGDSQGIIAIESTGTVMLSIHWPISTYDPSLPQGQRFDHGFIRTRGFVTDLPNILNCTRMETYRNVGADKYGFVLDGEPTVAGKIIPGRYFYANWKIIL